MPRGARGGMGRETWRAGRERSMMKKAMLGKLWSLLFLGAIVPVAEPDLGCGDEILGGECALKRAKLDPAGEIVK